MSFPCTKCGLCCKNIAGIAELKDFDLGNGVCKYFDCQSNTCKIYATRPKICQIDSMYESHYAKSYSKEIFYSLNANVCNRLQEKCGISKDFRVIITH